MAIDLVIHNININKWWRLFNLKGMRLKLTKPISTFSHPEFKGDRNFIIVNSYVANGHTDGYNLIMKNGEKPPPIFSYSDMIVYRNELTNPSSKHMINLSLLDFEYFSEQLTKEYVQNKRRIKTITE